MTAVIQRDQTLADFAIQYCGSVEAMFPLALLNGLEITDQPDAGTELLIPDVADAKVTKYFSDNNLKPITNFKESDLDEGIEFWAIEYDFVIS